MPESPGQANLKFMSEDFRKKSTVKIIKSSICILLLMVGSGCEQLKEKWGYFFPEESVIDHCDPVHNYYYNEQHYIGREFVKEDGTIDYKKWFEARKTENSPCDPLKKESKEQSPQIEKR